LLNPSEIIELLDLVPLAVEGGYFRQTYLSRETIPASALPHRYHSAKPYSSAIYYLLYDDLFSAMHRLPTDEVYHHYLGDPVEMLLLLSDGTSRTAIIGPDLGAGHRLQSVAPGGSWQGSRLIPGGKVALLGTTMSPAYTDDDFELGMRTELIDRYPAQEALIRSLTVDNQG
jgi:predicted cupin superfamily sugar epimerase